jgi:hypothetical protein
MTWCKSLFVQMPDAPLLPTAKARAFGNRSNTTNPQILLMTIHNQRINVHTKTDKRVSLAGVASFTSPTVLIMDQISNDIWKAWMSIALRLSK